MSQVSHSGSSSACTTKSALSPSYINADFRFGLCAERLAVDGVAVARLLSKGVSDGTRRQWEYHGTCHKLQQPACVLLGYKAS